MLQVNRREQSKMVFVLQEKEGMSNKYLRG